MTKRLRWELLGTSAIANEMAQAISAGAHGVVAAIASRTINKAQEAAERLGIPKAFGTYEELLADEDIDIV